jgi:L-ascorbate metabolism protein UlaG (beta-lactamase superfamily)
MAEANETAIGLTRRFLLKSAAALPILATPAAALATGPGNGMEIQRLAWAGIRLRIGDVALFIDAIAPNPQGGVIGPALAGAGGRNFALVTHHHPDHYDPGALAPLLGASDYVVAYEDSIRQFVGHQLTTLPARLHEPIFLSRGNGEFVARCVPASDGLGSPQVSWIVDGAGRKIIHCGDTAWHGGWWDIGRAYGPFDIAFLPINGFRQTGGRFQETREAMSLTPEQAVHAARIMAARLVVPIHYGTPASPNYVEERDLLGRFSREAVARSVPVRILVPGEMLTLDERRA